MFEQGFKRFLSSVALTSALLSSCMERDLITNTYYDRYKRVIYEDRVDSRTGEKEVIVPRIPSLHYAFVSENIDRIMAEHRGKFDIPPFPRPHITLKEYFYGEDSWKSGQYNTKIDIIDINNSRTYLSERDADSGVFLITVINHELGHYYSDKFSELLGRGDWPVYDDDYLELQTPTRLISEGVGEYFGRGWRKGEPEFEDLRMPLEEKRLEAFWYDGGYRLVRPIIEKYGVVGMIFLLLYPPKRMDVFDLRGYQRRVLEALERGTNGN